MELVNMTDPFPKPIWLLSNCTVDTSYRFTFYQVSYSVIFLLGLATNSLALRRMCFSSCTMNSTAIYMVSLAIADFCFVISLPLRIYYYHQQSRASSWTPGAVYCQVTFMVKYVSFYGGILFLVCIAVDRYFAVVHPISSTARRLYIARVVSGGIWCLVLGLSVGLPSLRSAGAHRSQPCLLDPSFHRHRIIILIALGLVLGAFLLPTLLLLFSYCRVLRVLSQKRRRCRSHQRALRVIYWVLGVFLLCFLPYHINLLGFTLTQVGLLHHCGLAKVTKALHPVVLSLASFNCCLNPLVYYFSSSLVHREASSSGGSGSQ